MKNPLTEYESLTQKKRVINQEIKAHKRKLHFYFKEKYSKWLRIFDYAMLFAIIFNFGALFITNALVIKEEPTKGFVEANPTQCDWNGYRCAETSLQFLTILRQMAIWIVVIGLYLFTRHHLVSEHTLYILAFTCLVYIVITSYDFIWDLGFYIGKIIWGF